MNEIDEQKSANQMTGSQALLVLLVFATFFVVIFYFDIGKRHSENEELVTLSVKASDVPEHIPNTKYEKRQYLLKAQEFNCHFSIIDGGYDLIIDNNTLKEQLENIKRGDDLKIVIYKSEEKSIDDLYFKGTLAGLSANGKMIFAPEEVRMTNKARRSSNFLMASIVWCLILAVLIIVRITKNSG